MMIEAIAQQRKSLTITGVKIEDLDSVFEETKRNLFNIAQTFGLNLIVQEGHLPNGATNRCVKKRRLYGL